MVEIKHLRKDINDLKVAVDKHFEKLNGQVAENTAGRHGQRVINIVLGAIGVGLIGVSLKLLFS